MKRSQMIDLMWEYIQEIEFDYNSYMSIDKTDKLLSKMEEAGMLPPTSTVVNGTIFEPKWDPEDE